MNAGLNGAPIRVAIGDTASLSANKYYQLLRSLVSLTIICFFLQTFWLIVYSVISVRTCLFLYSNMKSKLHAWNTILITWIGSSKAEHWHDLLFSSQWSLWADNQVFSKRDMDILFKKRGWVNLEFLFFFFVIWNCFINDIDNMRRKNHLKALNRDKLWLITLFLSCLLSIRFPILIFLLFYKSCRTTAFGIPNLQR